MTSSLATIDRIVGQVDRAKAIDRVTVEKITGTKLSQSAENNNYLTYQSNNVQADTLKLSVELREPNRNGDPTNGSLLILRILSGCPARSVVEARYTPWTISNVPRGGSLDEETSWSRRETWGKLSFGFAERSPDCLSTIVFDANK